MSEGTVRRRPSPARQHQGGGRQPRTVRAPTHSAQLVGVQREVGVAHAAILPRLHVEGHSSADGGGQDGAGAPARLKLQQPACQRRRKRGPQAAQVALGGAAARNVTQARDAPDLSRGVRGGVPRVSANPADQQENAPAPAAAAAAQTSRLTFSATACPGFCRTRRTTCSRTVVSISTAT